MWRACCASAAGDALRLFNGDGGEFEATIDSVRRDEVSVRIGAHHAVERESPLRIVLLQGIARGEKMDLILQKATELGVHAFVPLMIARARAPGSRRRRHRASASALARRHRQRLRTERTNTVPRLEPAAQLEAALETGEDGLKLLLFARQRSLATGIAVRISPGGAARCLSSGRSRRRVRRQRDRTGDGQWLQACRLGPRVLRARRRVSRQSRRCR